MSDFYQRQYLSGQVQSVDPVGMNAKANLAYSQADSSAKLGQAIVEKATDIYLSDIEVQARSQLRDAFNKNKANPQGFKKDAETIGKQIFASGGALPAQRRAGADLYQKLSQSYLDKTQQNYDSNVTNEWSFKTMQVLDQRMADMAVEAKLAFRPDGTINSDAFVRMQEHMNLVENELSRTGPDGQYLFTPQQRYSMLESSRLGMLQSAMDGMLENKSPVEVWRAWEDNNIKFSADVGGQNAVIDLKKGLSPVQQEKIGNYIKSKTSEYYSIWNQQQQFVEKQNNIKAAERQKTMVDLANKGLLTMERVRESRDILSPSEYEKWTERAETGGPSVTNRYHANQVGILLGQGKSDEALSYLSENQQYFNNADLLKYQSRAYDTSPVEMERSRMLKALGEGMQNLRMPEVSAQNMAAAEREYQEEVDVLRKEKGREPSAFEASEVAKRITERYSYLGAQNTSMTLAKPQFMETSEKQNLQDITPQRFKEIEKQTIIHYAKQENKDIKTMSKLEFKEWMTSNVSLQKELRRIRDAQNLSDRMKVNNGQ